MTLTDTQARDRFGMTTQDAHNVRDRALQSLTPAQVAEARAAWTDMAAIVRNSHQHPETIRFKLLTMLAAGHTIKGAARAARDFARGITNNDKGA
jgi:hypothetical protein